MSAACLQRGGAPAPPKCHTALATVSTSATDTIWVLAVNCRDTPTCTSTGDPKGRLAELIVKVSTK